MVGAMGAFERTHGRSPGYVEPIADWVAAGLSVGEALEALVIGLPGRYPRSSDPLRRVPVAVAVRAAKRALESSTEMRLHQALGVVEAWLRGETVADSDMLAAKWLAGDASDDGKPGAQVLQWAIQAARRAYDIVPADGAFWASMALGVATNDGDEAEIQRQWADLWELLGAALGVAPGTYSEQTSPG